MDGGAKKTPTKQLDSLMEHTRLKNIAICRRKLPQNLSISDLVKAINALDTKTISNDTIELLQRMIPVEAEVKAYREYSVAGKDIEKLTDEDKLMRQFSAVERFATKLQIMSFMSGFDEVIFDRKVNNFPFLSFFFLSLLSKFQFFQFFVHLSIFVLFSILSIFHFSNFCLIFQFSPLSPIFNLYFSILLIYLFLSNFCPIFNFSIYPIANFCPIFHFFQNFQVVKMVKPQIDTVSVASKSLRNSAKLKRVLELILALGNYMNSAKKGPCYGFKLQSLDSLTITKSTDKKQHLVHYLNDLVLSRYPELKGFEGELKFIEKAAQFSLENILTGKNNVNFLKIGNFFKN